MVRAFGINVPLLLLTFTYGLGSALAGLAGILAAPVYQVSPLMGSNIIIVVFAVVVVGGMGSIGGGDPHRLHARPLRGPDQGLLPRGSSIVIFVIMAIVLLVRPAGLFGRAA